MKFAAAIGLTSLLGGALLMAAQPDGSSPDSPATGAAPATASTQPASTTQPASGKNMSAEQMLSRMLKTPPSAAKPLQPINGANAQDTSSGGGAVAPSAPAVPVLREGTFLVDRVGRISRSADGSQTEFRFDADGKALHDPPVIVLPNLKLMSMEQAVAGANRDLLFRISGTLTEYKGRNYVLLEKVVVVPDPLRQF